MSAIKKFAKTSLFILCILTTIFAMVATQLPVEQLWDLPSEVELSYSDLANIRYRNIEVETDIDANVSSGDTVSTGKIILKAFGIFPLRTIKAKVVPQRIVFAGGYPLGMVINSDGVVVISSGSVTVNEYEVEGVALQKGDIIKQINGQNVLQIADIAKILKENGESDVTISLEREGKLMQVKATPLFDTATKEYKLGVWVKDKVVGLGTVSYVKPNGRYGALGHAIIDSDTGNIFPCFVGKAYDAKIIGCEKGEHNKPGSLKGVFSGMDKSIGTIEKNMKYGVFGILDKCDKNARVVDVASRLTVKPGKASIITTVDNEMKEYSIDIIKATKQRSKNDKGLIIKITDKELLKKTGGILQGMSGSPIIQNDKVVGALTHVFVSDPTKGYGVYLDFMLDN